MPNNCPKCESANITRNPGPPCAMECYTCADCGEEIAVHCHYIVDHPQVEIEWLRCSYKPTGSAPVRTKARMHLSRLLKKFNPINQGDLEQQYADAAAIWFLGSFRREEFEQFSSAAAALGILIESEKCES